MKVIRAFIQYAQGAPEYQARIRELADRLRRDGIESMVDQYEPNPPDGWQSWMTRQIIESDFVLIVCSASNRRRFDLQEAPGQGLGATWEGHLIRQQIHKQGTRNEKFIPVLLEEGDAEWIPDVLQPFTHYRLYDPAGYDLLFRRLSSQPEVLVPAVGPLRAMPPRDATEGGTTARQVDRYELPPSLAIERAVLESLLAREDHYWDGLPATLVNLRQVLSPAIGDAKEEEIKDALKRLFAGESEARRFINLFQWRQESAGEWRTHAYRGSQDDEEFFYRHSGEFRIQKTPYSQVRRDELTQLAMSAAQAKLVPTSERPASAGISPTIPTPPERWFEERAINALAGLKQTGATYYRRLQCTSAPPISAASPASLLKAARSAVMQARDWPIAFIIDGTKAIPDQSGFAIEFAQKVGGPRYEYLAADQSGRLLILESQHFDQMNAQAFFYDAAIATTAEALIYVADYYRALGCPSTTALDLHLEFGGLNGRSIRSTQGLMLPQYNSNVSVTDLATAGTTFRVGELRRVLLDKVIELLTGPFNQFAFFNPKKEIYAHIVEQTLGRALLYPDVTVQHQEAPQGLTVFMSNTGLDPISDCELVLQRLDRYSAAHDDFERNPLEPLVLVRARLISAGGTSDGAYLPFVSRTDKSEVVIQPHAGGRAPIHLKTAGTWRARLAIIGAKEVLDTTDLFFTWAPGSEPKWVGNPRQKREVTNW